MLFYNTEIRKKALVCFYRAVCTEQIGNFFPVEFTNRRNMMKKKEERDPVRLVLAEQFNLKAALEELPKASWRERFYRRSFIFAIPMLFLGALLYWSIWLWTPWLVAKGLVPSGHVPANAYWCLLFMLGGVSSMQFTASRFLSTQAMLSMSQITASVESLAAIVVPIQKKKMREQGFNLLKYLCYSIVLFAEEVPFVVVHRRGEGKKNYYDSILAMISLWSTEAGVHAGMVTSSSSLIRLTLPRGLLTIVLRFGLRIGLQIMPVMYYLAIFVLVTLEFRHIDAPIFGMMIMSLSSYLMAVMMKVTHNEANPLREMSGNGSFGLHDRLSRLVAKVDEQANTVEDIDEV